MPKEQPPIPSVLSFILCDMIISEEKTTKKTLVGIFDRAIVAEIPTAHGPFGIYVKLIDAEGEYVFRIEIVKLESDKPIARAVTPAVQIADRLKGTELTMRVPIIPLEERGTYEFQLYANDVWIGRTTLVVEKQGS